MCMYHLVCTMVVGRIKPLQVEEPVLISMYFVFVGALCQLFHKVQQILQPWPHLIKLFTEFMEPQDCLEAEVVSSILIYMLLH